MKKVLFSMVIIFLLFIAGVYVLYQGIWSPSVSNTEPYDLYIPSSTSYDDVYDQLIKDNILSKPVAFDLLAGQMKYKRPNVKSGRYIIQPDVSNRWILAKLRSGDQEPVKVTFNNIRTIDQLAGVVSRQIEPDSIELLSVFLDQHQLDQVGHNPSSVAALFIPNTYEMYWDATAKEFFDRMAKEYNRFWASNGRQKKAENLGLSPTECTILASIVEKESNLPSEKKVIAGLYLNRLQKGMPLQADPTVVFGVGDFTIKRVLNKHLLFDSPYNTYLNSGLPPGPICLPEISTIDAVLNPEDHRLLYMCAKPGYNGEHLFAENLIDHNRNARTYQQWLNSEGIMR